MNDSSFLIRPLFQSLGMCEILMDYSYLSTNVRAEAKRSFMTTSNLLIALPVGNGVFVSACFRQLAEELLRMLFFQKVDPAFDVSRYLPFQLLWDRGVKELTWKDEKVVESVNQLASMFKENSQEIHNISVNAKNVVDYLELLASSSSIQSKKTVNSYIRTINYFFTVISPLVFNLDISLMTMAQRYQYRSIYGASSKVSGR